MKQDIQKNINVYMNKAGIKKYTALLMKMVPLLDEPVGDKYIFIQKEKSNFTKMIKGERPLAGKYIVPLEKVLGVSIKTLCGDEDCCDEPNEKGPFLMGVKYCAYKDETTLYNKLDMETDLSGNAVIFKYDEFDRTLLDYLVYYKSFNGLKFLVEKHGFRVASFVTNAFYAWDCPNLPFSTGFIEVARFVAESDDPTLFDSIFRPFEGIPERLNGEFYSSIEKDRFVEAIVKSKNIFESLFKTVNFSFEQVNHGATSAYYEKKQITFINPFLNLCLSYCLKHAEEFEKETIKILEFGVFENKRILKSIPFPTGECFIDRRGHIMFNRRDCLGNILFAGIEETGNPKIDDLIRKLDTIERR